MTSAGAGPWTPRVGAGLHLVVLAGALYFAAAGITPAAPLPLTAFVVGVAALLALEAVPVGGPVARLVARAALIHAVVAVDASGLSRALFLLVPFTAYLALGRRAGLATAAAYAAGLVGWLTLARPGWHTDAEQVSDLLMFLVGLVFAVSMAGAAAGAESARARTELLHAELAGSHRRLGEYAERVAELSAAQERNRLARDIHDSLGHHLTAVAIQLDKAVAYRDRDAAQADRAVADARGSARDALLEVRGSVAVLRSPPGPPATPLAAALDALRAQLDTGAVRIDCAVHGDEAPHAHALTALYRAAQEGLTNAVRHAAATRIEVTARFADDSASLTVRDDGRGLPAPVDGGFGLAGMRERLAAVGGDLRLSATPGGGTTLVATVPRGSTR